MRWRPRLGGDGRVAVVRAVSHVCRKRCLHFHVRPDPAAAGIRSSRTMTTKIGKAGMPAGNLLLFRDHGRALARGNGAGGHWRANFHGCRYQVLAGSEVRQLGRRLQRQHLVEDHPVTRAEIAAQVRALAGDGIGQLGYEPVMLGLAGVTVAVLEIGVDSPFIGLQIALKPADEGVVLLIIIGNRWPAPSVRCAGPAPRTRIVQPARCTVVRPTPAGRTTWLVRQQHSRIDACDLFPFPKQRVG